jgi:hypothetical protein
MMFASHSFARILKTTSLAALVAASTSAFAGSTIKIANTSKAPWCLRITEDVTTPVMAQDPEGKAVVELSGKNNKLVYTIQPGEVCVLQFKEMKALPLKAAIGVVDSSGVEKGQIALESKVADVPQTLGAQEQERCCTFATLETLVQNVLRQDSHDSLSIISDAWR